MSSTASGASRSSRPSTRSSNYGTAPMPVDDAKPELYGSGYINGTIIGIPKNGKHQREAWELVKWLTTDTHALAKLSNGIRNVPVDGSSSKLEGADPGRALRDVPEDLRQPEVGDDRRSRPIGVDHLHDVPELRAKWQAGKVRNLHAGLQDVDKQLDAKVEAGRKGGGACREARRRSTSRGCGPGRRRSIGGGPGGARPGAAARLVLAADEPLARRLHRVLRLSARDERLPVVHALRPAVAAALDRLANYRYLFAQDPQVWPAVKNTLWLIAVMVPLQVLFAFGIAT